MYRIEVIEGINIDDIFIEFIKNYIINSVGYNIEEGILNYALLFAMPLLIIFYVNSLKIDFDIQNINIFSAICNSCNTNKDTGYLTKLINIFNYRILKENEISDIYVEYITIIITSYCVYYDIIINNNYIKINNYDISRYDILEKIKNNNIIMTFINTLNYKEYDNLERNVVLAININDKKIVLYYKILVLYNVLISEFNYKNVFYDVMRSIDIIDNASEKDKEALFELSFIKSSNLFYLYIFLCKFFNYNTINDIIDNDIDMYQYNIPIDDLITKYTKKIIFNGDKKYNEELYNFRDVITYNDMEISNLYNRYKDGNLAIMFNDAGINKLNKNNIMELDIGILDKREYLVYGKDILTPNISVILLVIIKYKIYDKIEKSIDINKLTINIFYNICNYLLTDIEYRNNRSSIYRICKLYQDMPITLKDFLYPVVFPDDIEDRYMYEIDKKLKLSCKQLLRLLHYLDVDKGARVLLRQNVIQYNPPPIFNEIAKIIRASFI